MLRLSAVFRGRPHRMETVASKILPLRRLMSLVSQHTWTHCKRLRLTVNSHLHLRGNALAANMNGMFKSVFHAKINISGSFFFFFYCRCFGTFSSVWSDLAECRQQQQQCLPFEHFQCGYKVWQRISFQLPIMSTASLRPWCQWSLINGRGQSSGADANI